MDPEIITPQYVAEPVPVVPAKRRLPWGWIAAGLAVAALFVWIYGLGGSQTIMGWFKKKDTDDSDSTGNSNSGNGTSATSTASGTSTATVTATSSAGTSIGWSFPLKKGVGTTSNPCAEVKTLQEMLNYYLKTDITVDGAWGSETETAMKKLRASTRVDRYGNPAPLWQFKDYMEDVSGLIRVSYDHWHSMCGYNQSIWANDKNNGLNKDIA